MFDHELYLENALVDEAVSLVDKLRGNEFDMKGLSELQSLLHGDKHGQ